LLTGSIESKIRADRSPAFGALKAFSKSKVEALIEQLIQDGYIARDEQHEYRLLSLTPAGEEARPPDLAAYAELRRAPATAAGSEPDLGAADHVLYERLTEWRRAKALQEEVPPYVVAHNSMLRNLAVARPATKAALLAVPGFGETRVDRYGTELLAVIGDTAASGN
jgi:superfamily II DNA helicase RecQ